MLPAGVSSTCPWRPGEVPNTTLPPEYAWLTGVTSLDSPPRTLSTQTRSCRVATSSSELMPTKYLNGPTPRRYMSSSFERKAHRPRQFCSPSPFHPLVRGERVVDHLAHRRVEAEEAVRKPERLDRVAHRAHAAHQVRPAAADHHVERRRPVRAEMLAQRIRHRAEGLVDVGVVRLAADDEKHVRLRKPVLEADARDVVHLLVRRVAAEVRRDDRVVAERLRNERIGAAAESGREDRALRVDHEHVALALVGAQLIDLVLEVGIVTGEQARRQAEALAPRVVAVEAALEVARHGHEAPASPRAHADRVELERGQAVVVEELPELRQVLHQRRDDFAWRADVGEGVGDNEGLEARERLERHLGDVLLVELLDR